MNYLKRALWIAFVSVLSACGGGGGNPGGSGSDGSVTNTPQITLTVLNSASLVTTSVTNADVYTLRAVVTDATSAPLKGQVVTFDGDTTLLTFAPAKTALTDENGVASVKVSPATAAAAGATVITADVAVAGVKAVQATTGVQIVPLQLSGPPSVSLEMRNPAGLATTTLATLDINTVRVTVRNALGNLSAGQSVTLTSSSGHVKFLPTSTVLTDANGFASVQVLRNSPTDAGTDRISAAVNVAGTLTTLANLDMYVSPLANAGIATLTLSLKDQFGLGTNNVPHGGVTTAQLQLVDANGSIPPATKVTFSGDETLINFPQSALSDPLTGRIAVPITAVASSESKAGTLTASATLSGVAVAASLDFQVTGAPTISTQAPVLGAVEIRNSANGPTANLSSLDIYSLRATLKDALGVPQAGQVIKFTADSSLVKFSPASGTALTNTDGVAVVQVSPASATAAGAGVIGVDASVNGLAAKQLTMGVNVTPIPNSGLTTITLLDSSNANSTTISALASSTLKATVKDAFGNALPGQMVKFSSANGLVKFSPAASAITDISGVARVEVSRSTTTSVGADQITAQVTVGGVAATPAVLNAYVSPLVNGGLPSMTVGLRDSAMASSITIVPRAGTSYVRVQILDATGAAPAPTTVSFAADTSLVNIPSTGLTDSTGVAMVPLTVVSTSVGGASTLRVSANVPVVPGAAPTVTNASVDFLVPSGSTAGVPAMNVALASGGNSVTAAGTSYAVATVKDASGTAVPGKLVTFTGDPLLIKFSPASGQVLTDSSGVASIQVAPLSLSSAGASTLTARTTVGTALLVTSFDFQLSAAKLGLQDLQLGSGSLPAYGNRAISVTANIDGSVEAAKKSPVQVTFTASCGTVNPSVVTTDALAVASTSYTANSANCSGSNVAITASAVGASSQTGTISVANSIATNIQFVSGAPQLIYLKDTVGTTQAQVVFKVVDSTGNPLQNKQVKVSLSTTATGVSLDTVGNTAPVVLTTDASGLVSVAVFSGTVPTALNVKASLVDNASVTTNSNLITVASGRPTQRSLSLSLEKFAIEAANVDGQTSTVTLSMADRQGNPVPPGTQVNFVTEGGVMLPAVCFVPPVIPATANSPAIPVSSCTTTLKASGTRTATGKVTIMAYVAGEEDFVDANGNNVYDAGESFSDLGRAYRDDNGSSYAGTDGVYNSGEFQVPRDGVSACVTGGACAGDGQWGAADVRKQANILFSTSAANITSGSLVANATVGSGGAAKSVLNSLSITVADQNRKADGTFSNLNSMPAGTTIDVSVVDDGNTVTVGTTEYSCTLTTSATYTVSNSYHPTTFTVGMKYCAPGDSVLVKVTSPLKVVTESMFTIQ